MVFPGFAALTRGLYIHLLAFGRAGEEEESFFFLLLFLFVGPCAFVENSGARTSFPRRPTGENEGAEASGLCAF